MTWNKHDCVIIVGLIIMIFSVLIVLVTWGMCVISSMSDRRAKDLMERRRRSVQK